MTYSCFIMWHINLPASLELGPLTHLDYLSKEVVLKGIENKGNFAAAVICGHLKEVPSQPQNPFMEDIVGLVALLGTVISYKLSRSFLLFYLSSIDVPFYKQKFIITLSMFVFVQHIGGIFR